MLTIFDVYSLALLIASMSLFLRRYMTHNPPVYPYLIIACTCLVSNWLGEAGGGVFALILLVAASFSFLGCLLYPSWRNMTEAQNDSAPASEDAA